MKPFFESVAQQEMTLGGLKVLVPVFYQDVTSMNAVLTASTERVADLLPHPDLHPVELRRGRCLLSVTALEYRQSGIGPYNELAIAASVTFGRRAVRLLDAVAAVLRHAFSLHVLHLPVTTEVARVGGVELYGYPKFLADITFTRGEKGLACTLAEGGARILSLVGEDLGRYRPAKLHATTYSMKGETLLRTAIEFDKLESAETLRRGAATLEIGSEHRVARQLASLDVDPRPVLFQMSPRGRAILFEPHPAHETVRRAAA
ncbi:MAG TPA: acetoacetate decarboxylase family protein [Anaeromyxobacteraceae bacterium]|nr:acetoacetate decarboxylase family protein [Anaeromyxobacteraceae bacterium]